MAGRGQLATSHIRIGTARHRGAGDRTSCSCRFWSGEAVVAVPSRGGHPGGTNPAAPRRQQQLRWWPQAGPGRRDGSTSRRPRVPCSYPPVSSHDLSDSLGGEGSPACQPSAKCSATGQVFVDGLCLRRQSRYGSLVRGRCRSTDPEPAPDPGWHREVQDVLPIIAVDPKDQSRRRHMAYRQRWMAGVLLSQQRLVIMSDGPCSPGCRAGVETDLPSGSRSDPGHTFERGWRRLVRVGCASLVVR